MNANLRMKLAPALALFAAGWVASWWAHSRVQAPSGSITGSAPPSALETCKTETEADMAASPVANSSSESAAVTAGSAPAHHAAVNDVVATLKPSDMAQWRDAWDDRLRAFLTGDQPFRINRSESGAGWSEQAVATAKGRYKGTLRAELPVSRKVYQGSLELHLDSLAPTPPSGRSANFYSFQTENGASSTSTFGISQLGHDERNQALNVYWHNPESRDHAEAVAFAMKLPLVMAPGQPTRLELHALDENFVWRPVGQVVLTKK